MAGALLLLCSPAHIGHGQSPNSTEITDRLGEVTVNWTRGLLSVRAGASADLRAPTASIARVKAKRTAMEIATERLLHAATELPWGPPSSPSPSLTTTQLLHLQSSVILLSTVYSSDGSVVMTVGLPIEAIRVTRLGREARQPPAIDLGKAPTALRIQLAGIKPAIGYAIQAGSVVYRGPMLWRPSTLPRKDPHQAQKMRAIEGPRVVTVTANSYENGVIKLPLAQKALLEQVSTARSPVVVLLNQ